MPTIPALFLACVEQAPHKNFLHTQDKGSWKSYTRDDALQAVCGIAQRLYSLGIQKVILHATCFWRNPSG